LTNKTEWIGSETEPLVGFLWKSSTKRQTEGIIMWSDIFLHENETTGEKFAIIVIDTQGLFDKKTSNNEGLRVFGLNALISSYLVLNIPKEIPENILDFLQV
jgi:atlastin